VSEDANPPEDEQPLDPDNLPDGYSLMSISAVEMDYLHQYWEIRSPGQLFGWALRLLHDLTKADEANWCLLLQKGELDADTKIMTADPAYKAAVFRLEWMMPDGEGGFRRLPLERLEQLMKRLPEAGEGI
jgi:hypothetical protein